MREAGEVPLGAEADIKQGDALSLPFADGEFDRVVAAEVLEHIPDDTDAIAELVRVLRPGGTIAVTVPRWLPEKICWALSDAYHEVEGGHVRIYTGDELVGKLRAAGLVYDGRDHAHGLHSPYWWLKCAVGVTKDQHPLVKAYHRMLVWDIMRKPLATRLAERLLNPLIGKSLVVYLRKPDAAMSSDDPALPGCSAVRRRATAASIAHAQEPDGAVRGRSGPHRRLEPRRVRDGAAASAARSRRRDRAYDWCLATQRADGSWPMKIVAGVVEDASGETNMSRLPRGRRVAPLAGAARRASSCAVLARRATRRWTSCVGCSCRSAGSPGRRRTRRAAAGQPRGAAGRVVEHLPGAAAPGSRWPS